MSMKKSHTKANEPVATVFYRPHTKAKVFIVGDSYMLPSRGKGYDDWRFTETVPKELNLEPVNKSVPGGNTLNIFNIFLAGIEGWFGKFDYVIYGGTNSSRIGKCTIGEPDVFDRQELWGTLNFPYSNPKYMRAWLPEDGDDDFKQKHLRKLFGNEWGEYLHFSHFWFPILAYFICKEKDIPFLYIPNLAQYSYDIKYDNESKPKPYIPVENQIDFQVSELEHIPLEDEPNINGHLPEHINKDIHSKLVKHIKELWCL